jgi:hypothetical protein
VVREDVGEESDMETGDGIGINTVWTEFSRGMKPMKRTVFFFLAGVISSVFGVAVLAQSLSAPASMPGPVSVSAAVTGSLPAQGPATVQAGAATRVGATRRTDSISVTRYERSVKELGWDDPYVQLKLRSDSVYVARVENFKREAVEAGVVRGRVTMRITAVITGAKIDTISLPYFFPDPTARGRQTIPQKWPLIEEAPADQLFLLVVSPGHVVRGGFPALPLDSEPLAASTVRPVTGVEDPIVKAFQKIAELAKTPESERQAALLAVAAAHPPVPLQMYLLGVITHELKPEPAFEVIRTLITSESANDRPNGLSREMALLSPYYLDKTATDENRTAVLGLLSRIVKSGSASNIRQAVVLLIEFSDSTVAPPPGFPKQERDLLEIAVSEVAAKTPEGALEKTYAPQVINWLKK